MVGRFTQDISASFVGATVATFIIMVAYVYYCWTRRFK